MNTRLSFLCIGLVALALSISNWTAVVIISTHPENIGALVGAPEIAVDGLGNSYVTWGGSDGNDYEIYWVKIDASGTPGTAQKISTHLDCVNYDDFAPQIAVDAEGNSYVIWFGYDGNDTEIYWVKIDAAGTLGTVKKISTHPDNIEYDDHAARICVDGSGNSYSIWEGSDGNDTEIYWVKIDAAGTPGTVKKISTHPDNVEYVDSNPQIAVDALGNSYVVWHGCDNESCWEEPEEFGIYWAKIDASGTLGTIQKVPTSPDNINTPYEIPRIAVDASGNSYVVWSGKDEKGHNIYWVKIDALGVLGVVEKISTHPDNVEYDDFDPQIAVNATGNSHVTWCGKVENVRNIYWVRIDSTGTPGTVLKISTYSGLIAYHDLDPQIAVDGSGNSYIAWQSHGQHFNMYDDDICWVKIDASGRPGRIEKISARRDSEYDDFSPQLAVDGSGNSYVVWEGGHLTKGHHIFFTACIPNPTLIVRVMLLMIAIIVVMIVIATLVVIARRKVRRTSLRNVKDDVNHANP